MVAPVELLLDKAVAIPSATIHAHVLKVRRRNPNSSPQQLVHLLEKEYLGVVQLSGGAVGVAAAAPAIGTGTAMALTAGDVATFFGASAAFALAVASVHGIEVTDTDRRKALLLSSILGESGAAAVQDAAGIGSVRVARSVLTHMPLATVRKVNTTLTRRLVRRQAVKQGGLALGRLAPFGIGLVIGVAGGRALARTVIEGARIAFGPAPLGFPQTLEIAGPAAPTTPTDVPQITAR